MTTNQSFEALEAKLKNLPSANIKAAEKAGERQNQLTKPPGSLGKLEELAIFMASWQGEEKPEINKAQALVFAGNHGVCAQGVNPFPQEVTAIMVENFKNDGAAINQLCKANGASLEVIALDLDTPTKDITQAPAMSEAECLEAINTGANALNPDADIVLLGEMGIGNSTISSALCLGAFGGDARDWVGAGTGSDEAGRTKKAEVIAKAANLHQQLAQSSFGLLRALGGREQAAICGALIAARMNNIPVIIDGFIASAAIAPLHGFDGIYDHVLIAHKSAEAGHARLLDALGLSAILDLDMRLGEGSGAAVALGVLRSALACHNDMATFAEAGIPV